MKITKTKTATILIATFLIISMGASMLFTPTAIAHTPAWQIETFAYIRVAPEVVGVGQSTLIYMWLDKTFPGADMDNPYRFHDYKLTITKPDNSTEVKTWATVEDTTSSQSYSYTPTMAGTYYLKFEFPGNKVSDYPNPGDDYTTDTYLPSSSETHFTVVEDELPYLPASYPLPTEYWSRPIYGENSMWWTISSNWLGTGSPNYGGFAGSYNYGGNGMLFPDDAIGPETSHVMWTKPLQSGGVVGGDNFEGYYGNTYFEGSAYLQRYTNPIIVNGKLYYTEPVSYLSPSGGPTTCVDLRTGEEIWSRTDVPALSHAIIFDAENPNQHGVYNALLVAAVGGGFFGGSTSWRFFDADTGNALFNASGIPSGRKAMGPMGENLIYQVTNLGSGMNYNWTLRMWNSSRLWTWSDTPSIAGSVDASTANRFEWSIPLTWANSMTPVFSWTGSTVFTVVEAYYNDVMLCYNGTLPSTGSNFFFGSSITYNPYTYFAINLNESRGPVGQVLWRNTVTPTENVTIMQAGIDPVNRVFVENVREKQCFNLYDLDTGKFIKQTEPQDDMDYYGSPASGSLANCFAYGKMYSSAYAGIVYCYDTNTGDLLWTYGNGGPGNSTDSGWAVPGHYPTFVNAYGNGLIYLVTTEHTIQTPLYKGSLLRAINATDGTEVWTINGYVGEFMTTSYAIADGYATWFNGLDNQIYVVGKGPSQTTVNAPSAGLTPGQSVVITGSVTDIAAGTTQHEQASRFPNGVSCSSDASMKDWMGYVYQQKPLPTNFTGVEVSIYVIDSNENYRSIGVATTDSSGTYSLNWTPDIEGKYTVIATFAGNNGYWPSSARSAFAVDQAQATATPVPTQAPSPADLYFIPAIAGLFVLIIIVLVLLVLVLRKRQ